MNGYISFKIISLNLATKFGHIKHTIESEKHTHTHIKSKFIPKTVPKLQHQT